MNTQLTETEIQAAQQLLADYEPAQKALTALEKHKGQLEASFDELWSEQAPQTYQGKSLWETTIKVLRQEICGDEGFRTQFKGYTRNPGSAPLLTGLIVSLTTMAGLPLDPAIATVIVLYLVKIGLEIFCEQTRPEEG